jgi:GT2 family glycosyltransferase
VPGCYYLVRREVIDQVGLFDPRFFLYFEEVDHCRAVKAAGWQVLYFPYTTVVHIGGESAKSDALLTSGRQISELQVESELLYFRKHHGRLGVLSHLALSVLADLIVGTKNLIRVRSGRSAIAVQWRVWRTRWGVLMRTHWGLQATR